MDMDLMGFFNALMNHTELRDDRPMAVRAWSEAQRAEYRMTEADEAFADAEIEYDDIELAHWEERWANTPGWTNGEEAFDTIEMAQWDARCASDARNEYWEVRNQYDM